MNPAFIERLGRTLLRVAAAGACGFILLYLYTALRRIDFPFQLEWGEGGSLEHVRRVLAGDRIYVRPTLHFIPLIYNPLYFYVAALAAKLGGASFMTLRMVSLLASIGCFAMLFLAVRRETRTWASPLLSSGLFAACYAAGGAWMDIARIDSLFLFLLLAGFHVARCGASLPGAAASGAIFLLAYLTKQTALPIALCLALAMFISRGWRSATVFSVVGFGGAAAVSLLFGWWSGGWYFYYAFTLPRSHGLVPSYFGTFWIDDIGKTVAPALAFGLIGLGSGLRKNWRGPALLDAAFLFGAFATSCLARMHYGGYNNVVLPAYAAAALCFGPGVQVLASHWFGEPGAGTPAALSSPARSGPLAVSAALLMPLFIVLQFRLLVYDPRLYIPTPDDLRAGQELLAGVRSAPGEVLLMRHGYLPADAGKTTSADYMALYDVIRGPKVPAREELLQEIDSAIRERRFDLIVLDPQEKLFEDTIAETYRPVGPVFGHPAVFWTRSGMKTRPDTAYRPK